MAITKKWRGICANIAGNNNKFWEIELHDNSDVITRWGRVSEEGKAQSKPFIGAGENFFDKKINEKKNKSNPDERYTEVRTLDSASGSGQGKIIQSQNLVEIAKREINSNSKDTIMLIERLAAANIHNITSQTTMTFNKVTGLFETPLGIVTADAIVEARDWLSKIGNFVATSDWNNHGFASAINQYMRLIPSDFGRQRVQPKDLFPALDSVQKQNDILDSLDGSLQMVLSAPVSDPNTPAPKVPKLFDTTLNLCEDGKVFDKLNKFYNQTRQSIHAASKLNIHKIYEVEIATMNSAYQTHGVKVGNVQELWHGTKIGNLLSIIKGGFIIPPSNAGYCTGRMFGNGVYFSDQSTKSLNYAMGYAPGQRGGYSYECFMFVNDVAMGRSYIPTGSSHNLNPLKDGYDSTFAMAGKSGVINNEMIVYRTNQISPRYLVEFK